MEIQVINNSLLARLPEASKPYIEAKDSKKIREMEMKDACDWLFILISKTINASGENKQFHLDGEQLRNVSKFVYNYVYDNYKGITLKEIENAFNLGLTHEFGQYVGYGVTTFSKFIKGYMNSQKRESAMKEWFKLQDEGQTTEKPVTEFLKQNDEILTKFFDLYNDELAKRMGSVYTSSDNEVYHLPSIYDFVLSKYVIEFTPETKDKIIKDAKLRYYNYIKLSGLPKHKVADYNNIIYSVKEYMQDELYNIIEATQRGTNITFDYYIKSEALKVITSKLKSKGKTFNNLKLKP